MKKYTLSLVLIICSTLAYTQSHNYLTDFQKKWKNARDYTIELALLMPEKHYRFKPTSEVKSFQGQMIHLIGNMTWLSTDYLGGSGFEKDLKQEVYTKDEVIDLLKEGFDYAAQAVENLKLEDLEEVVEFFAGPMTKRQILNLMTDHVTHHRGQAIIYVRLKNIKPPRYRGW